MATLAGILSNTTPPPGHGRLKVPETGMVVLPGRPSAQTTSVKRRWQACLASKYNDAHGVRGSRKAPGARRGAPGPGRSRVQGTDMEGVL